MTSRPLAKRSFTMADQEAFALLSGDRNPMHMDTLVARRTMAGYPVVHGMHALLWGLDRLFSAFPGLGPVAAVSARFDRMLHVNDQVELVLVRRDGQRLNLHIIADGTTATRFTITLGGAQSNNDADIPAPAIQPPEPIALAFEDMAWRKGWIPFSATPTDAKKMFPAATSALGHDRVSALACTSFLVGMVCPGLHSIYSSLDLAAITLTPRNDTRLNFRVTHSDARFRLVKLAAWGGGWAGSLETLVRPPPTPQASISVIKEHIRPGEFQESHALIVGGSRGLGELVGKMLAVGGAHVTLTYARGEADAHRVQAEILAAEGKCNVMHYDALKNAAEQISRLPAIPDQLYYFATPPIFRRRSKAFIDERFQDFLAYYAGAFHALCKAVRDSRGKPLSIFYPSSVSIETRPANMTEYTMAKAAGEILCADMQTFGNFGKILVQRLPRLPTDQTATISHAEVADPITIMLPIVRAVYAQRPSVNGP